MRDENIPRRNTPVSDKPIFNGLHPRVYTAMVILALWFVIAGWIGFGGGGYAEYLLVIVTGFFSMAVALPLIAGHEWHRFHTWMPRHTDNFDEWLSSEFQVDQTHMPARTAMLLILLPLMAAAFSMTAFAIVALALE
jgi:hypothetical protein